MSPQSSSARARDFAFRHAVTTGLLSKGGGVVLQLVAMPFAIREIGLVAFGQYATAIAAFSWVMLGEALVGQAMVRRIVAGVQNSDTRSVTEAVYTGLATAALFAAIVGVIVCTCVAVWVIITARSVDWAGSTLYFAAGLAAVLKLILGVTARTRSALQQTHLDNIYNAFANLVSLAAVFFLLPTWPNALILLLVLFIPTLAAQTVSAIHMFVANPILGGAARIDFAMACEFLGESWWLLLGQIGTMCERQLPLVVFSLASLTSAAGQYAIAMQLILMAASPLVMITTPLMPAIVDAMHSKDHLWWVKRVRLLDRGIILTGCVTIVFAFFYGPAFLHLLFGPKKIFSAFACAALCGWVTAILSALIYYCVLIAKGEASLLGKTLCLQGFFFAALSAPAFLHLGFEGLFMLGMALTALITRQRWVRRVGVL